MSTKTQEATDVLTSDSGDIKIATGGKKKGFSVSCSWKTLAFVILLVTGAGGFGVAGKSMLGLDVGSKVSNEEASLSTITADLRQNGIDHTAIRGKLSEHDASIGTLDQRLISVQTVQHRQAAREEARRVTEVIKDRVKRETAYDRLVDINLKHLAEGKDTCQTVDCGL